LSHSLARDHKRFIRISSGQIYCLEPVILATWEPEIGRITIGGQPRKKGCESPFQPWMGAGGVCHPKLCQEAQRGETQSQTSLGSETLSPKTQAKRARSMTQVGEHLPSKYEALSSTPRIAKQTNKKKIGSRSCFSKS
jgi:hypothetical protein